MPISEIGFWNEVERLDRIKTPDCPDSWLLMELGEDLKNDAASELTAVERRHIGMGCARCHRIMMLARITTFGDVELDQPEPEKPKRPIIEFAPRTWRITGQEERLAAAESDEVFHISYQLEGGNIRVRIGNSEEPGKYQVDVQSNGDCTCVVRIFDGAPDDSVAGEIVWPEVRLYANRKTILPLSDENLKLYKRFHRADLELRAVPGCEAAEGDSLA
jgi:hypothetical protein